VSEEAMSVKAPSPFSFAEGWFRSRCKEMCFTGKCGEGGKGGQKWCKKHILGVFLAQNRALSVL
jgi:hypothetical protein